MTKIAYNDCYGGFGLSDAGFEALLLLKGIEWEKTEGVWTDYWRKGRVGEKTEGAFLSDHGFYEDRTDPHLLAVILELGEEANGDHAQLKIRELPAGTKYIIDEYDGIEAVVTLDEHEWRIA